jgi:adenine/guanine phosphoribosyltransferase-like PRPP-binding protein
MRIELPAFYRDSRGNRLEKAQTRKVQDTDHLRLYLCGPDEVATQLEWVLRRPGARRVALAAEHRAHWTHRIHVSGPLTPAAKTTIALLQRILTLTEKPPLDVAIALDFYKDPNSHDDPKQWKDTAAGSMVYAAKYWGNPEALDDLADALAKVIREHHLYAGADFVAAVPGHKSNLKSFGENLAQAVAQKVGKPLLRPATAHEEREAAKTREQGEGARNLDGEFVFDAQVAGRVVIVVDDVCRSGTTMAAMAKAAKGAGAVCVLGLAGAQTMRR